MRRGLVSCAFLCVVAACSAKGSTGDDDQSSQDPSTSDSPPADDSTSVSESPSVPSSSSNDSTISTSTGSDAGSTTSSTGDAGSQGVTQAGSDQGPSPGAGDYPPGPYGLADGQTLSPKLPESKGSTWQCLAERSSTPTQLELTDLYDADGKKGINALLFDVSAVWCADCQVESSQLEAKMNGGWKADGVKVVILMQQDGSRQNPTVATLTQWRQTYNLQDVTICADPGVEVVPPGNFKIPYNVLVDPRSMKVVGRSFGPTPPDVDGLAKKNK
jgi:hypothetical protein